MKKLTFTLIGFFMWFSASLLQAQPCNLNCNDLVNISMDSLCMRMIEVSDVVNGDLSMCADSNLIVELEYPYTDLLTALGPNGVDKRLIGYTLVYRVKDTTTWNSCWGRVKIEDKYPPQIMCGDDTISCFIAEEYPAILADAEDNCMYPARTEVISHRWISYDCDTSQMFVGRIERTVRALDIWGNSQTCDQTLYIERESLDSLVCAPDTVIECCDPIFEDTTGTFVVYKDGYYIPLPVVDPLGNSIGLVDPPYIVNGGDTTYVWPNTAFCQIYADYKDHIIDACGHTYKIRREWKIIDWCTREDTICTQWIKIIDTLAPMVKPIDPDTVYTSKHECKAHFELERPPIMKECWDAFDEVTVRYSIEIPARHGISQGLYYSGELAPGEKEIVYLPSGWHTVNYVFLDGCLNSTTVPQTVYVIDDQPPTPICDEITQVTLDPQECWARVYAEDLDDGSHDNCCPYLHFAVASMDSIEYWTDYWHGVYEECLGHYAYHAHHDSIKALIDHWINCYVFDDYVDLTECGTEMVVLRVYEACGLPLYDPHIYKGSKHSWFCFNLYDDYACFVKSHYDEFAHYGKPRAELGCDYDDYVADPILCSTVTVTTGTANIAGDYSHVIEMNPLCCDFQIDPDHPLRQRYMDILAKYPEIEQLCDNRYTFPHLYNDCMVEIIKDDKVPPVCDAPDDKTVFCDGVPYFDTITIDKVVRSFTDPRYAANNPHFNPEKYPWDGYFQGDYYGYYAGPSYNVYGHESHTYGHDLCYENENWKPIYCRLWLILDRYDDPSYGKPNPKSYFDDAVITDNCELVKIDTIDEYHLNECGVGYITRTWTAYDGCENKSVCYQKVVIKARSDFEVCFPSDTLVDCTTNPDLSATEEGVGYPVVTDDDCEFIGVNYEDHKFEIVDEACYKIFRTWTIIDWCVYNPDLHERRAEVIVDDRVRAGEDRPCIYRKLKDNGDGIITYLQVIKVFDGNAPTLTCAEPFEICIEDEDCTLPDVNYELGSAVDECTPEDEIQYRWYVDPFKEGIAANFIFGKEEYQNRLRGEFPVGEHRAYLIASDQCGNEDTCYVDFEVKDCKKPTPYCYHGIATVIMPSTGLIKVWASDLDAGSFDNCAEKEELVFSFSDDIEDQTMEFSCDDIGEVPVTIYVWDPSGNVDFCETYLSIQANGNCSDSTGAAAIVGEIETENRENVQDVEVSLQVNHSNVNTFKTLGDGKFAFTGIPMKNTYSIVAKRNNDVINGVSTLDIVTIQKHVLGIQKLNSPYKVIAADINKSNSVTALDIVELRKLVLGIYSEFPNNESWRFVEKAYNFTDPAKPWGFPEEFTVADMDETKKTMNVIGVKIGDVNGTVQANGLQAAEIRSAGKDLLLQVEDRSVKAGDVVDVVFTAKDFKQVQGYQFTIESEGLQILNTKGNSLELTEGNFGRFEVNPNLVTSSWSDVNAITVEDGQALFTLTFTATEDILLSEALNITSSVTKAEAYANNQIGGIQIEFVKDAEVVETGKFELYQNNPNPFSKETTIGFVLPKAGEATIQIMDVTGKVVQTYVEDFAKGYNEIRVNKKDLPSTGILYYQLDAKDYTATKKMVLVE